MQEQKFRVLKPIILIIIGAIGIVLGAIGIFFGVQSQLKIKELKTGITNYRDLEIEYLELKKFVMSLEERLDKIGTEVVKNRESFESTFVQVDKVLENISNFLNKMKDNNESKHVIAQQSEGAPPSQSEDTSDMNDNSNNSTSDEISQGKLENGFHIISSGDTYEKLARIYKVKVQDIITANPDVNPRKLQLGQKIKVPQ